MYAHIDRHMHTGTHTHNTHTHTPSSVKGIYISFVSASPETSPFLYRPPCHPTAYNPIQLTDYHHYYSHPVNTWTILHVYCHCELWHCYMSHTWLKCFEQYNTFSRTWYGLYTHNRHWVTCSLPLALHVFKKWWTHLQWGKCTVDMACTNTST